MNDVPRACDFDLRLQENHEAVWLEFQRHRAAACPETGAKLDLALAHHPEDGEAPVAEVSVSCRRCGRRASFSPPDALEVFGWSE